MKTTLNLKRSIFFVAALSTVVSFTSCSDDDEPKVPSVTDVYGTYKGKVAVLSVLNRAESETPSALEVAAKVNNDTIYFEDFPVKDIVAVVEGENAASIVESIGKVNFKVGYKSKLNEAQDSIALTLDPKPMQFAYKVGEGEDAEEKKVSVSIVIPEDEKSAYSAKILKFNLTATEVLVNEVAVEPFNPLYYNFNLNKQ